MLMHTHTLFTKPQVRCDTDFIHFVGYTRRAIDRPDNEREEPDLKQKA